MKVHVGYRDQPNKPSKTEVLFVSAPPSCYAEPTTFDVRNLQPINLGNNRFLPVVTKFNYLSATLNIDCRDNEDVVFQTKTAGNAFGAIRKCLFPNPNVSVDAKQAVYEGLLSILLYGAESWCFTKKLFSTLRIFDNRCFRSIWRVTVTECNNFRISNEELLICLRKIDGYATVRLVIQLEEISIEFREKCCLRGYVLNT